MAENDQPTCLTGCLRTASYGYGGYGYGYEYDYGKDDGDEHGTEKKSPIQSGVNSPRETLQKLSDDAAAG
ncbi:hypothetical protein IYW40_00220 [Methylocystis sp. H4A]|uniref:hypothetical protein n=1 Tax=Methylocystis sp. H4A TaxID=2785788 RepID=UPI0018C29025|nr:hypothetical protein [Methylocystis sp. H4A]MBG0799961.1 hypothetical protein [Methylocystis sp. H4A]